MKEGKRELTGRHKGMLLFRWAWNIANRKYNRAQENARRRRQIASGYLTKHNGLEI